MKKFLLLAVVCFSFSATACLYRSNQSYYEKAQLYLGGGEYEKAAELFSQLGEYEDAGEYTMYARALEAFENENWAVARANLEAIAPFKSSLRYLRLIDAAELAEDGQLEAALSAYEALGTFGGSDAAADALRTEIPEQAISRARTMMARGEYAEARALLMTLDGYGASAQLIQNCTSALNRAVYTEADSLCKEGDHLSAMRAFLEMGDVLDAPERAEQCRAALMTALNTQAETANLDTAASLIAEYEAIGDPVAARQAAALEERFGVNLRLAAAAADQPYVLLGEYPTGESGVESALLWRVLSVENGMAVLLCETVIDASDIATSTDLMLTEAESAAVTSTSLPSAADLTALSDLSCAATPYAVAQGVGQEDGYAAYWLRDSLEGGLHPVVGSSGSLGLPDMDMTPGVRPMITISLEDYMFTAGDGTKENPFR